MSGGGEGLRKESIRRSSRRGRGCRPVDSHVSRDSRWSIKANHDSRERPTRDWAAEMNDCGTDVEV